MKLPLNINCCKVEGVVCDSKGHIQKLTMYININNIYIYIILNINNIFHISKVM